MKLSDAKKIHRRIVGGEIAYTKGRVGKLAHQLTSAGVSDDVGAEILAANLRIGEKRHNSSDTVIKSGGMANVGRRAQGAHSPTQGYVCVDGDFRLRVAQNPTCKVKDHKAHKAIRVRACVQAHAGAIDASRRYTHITAPYRPGGQRWAKLGRVGKREYRAILHTCDHMARDGEITAATELFRGI